jgi:hypothetical protein
MSPNDHSGIDELGMSVIKIQNGVWKLEDYAAFKSVQITTKKSEHRGKK